MLPPSAYVVVMIAPRLKDSPRPLQRAQRALCPRQSSNPASGTLFAYSWACLLCVVVSTATSQPFLRNSSKAALRIIVPFPLPPWGLPLLPSLPLWWSPPWHPAQQVLQEEQQPALQVGLFSDPLSRLAALSCFSG